jgi:dolichyl-phosphate-mannose-protein mannosyltransferase
MSDAQILRASQSETAIDRMVPRRDLVILVAATLLLLLPFVCKPFHIDDPMYLWAAKHIREHPLDFYGFDVNWGWSFMPQSMATANVNPPLGSFFLAGVSLFAGWSEVALHLGMLVAAVAAVLGTWRLARQFAAPPLLSALALLSLPGFLVSASTLMPDVLATALWCWAVVLWMEGLARGRIAHFAGAALLAGACVLTKYVGIGLILLLLVHGAVVRRRLGVWLAVPVVVALIALAYRGYVHSLYGVDPFAWASEFSLKTRAGSGTWVSHTLIGLAFLGGTASTVAFLSPWHWSWRKITDFGVVVLILAIAFSLIPTLVTHPPPASQGERWPQIAHLAVFVCLGLQIAILAARRLVRAPDADGILLVCWIGGIFVFAAYANWTTDARSLLPALPAVAILLLGEARRGPTTQNAWRLLIPLALGTTIALVVVHADYALARTTRAAAEDLAQAARSWNGPVRFEGNWGFQQYMESGGVRKLDFSEARLDPGTLLVLPPVGSNTPAPPDPTTFVVFETRQYPVAGLASTLSPVRGGGFYSDLTGPVPFALGRALPEQYVLLKIVRPITLIH